MLIDQAEIDRLMAQGADASLAEPGAVAVAPPPPRPRSPLRNQPAEIQRILRTRVPVIVQLARRPMPVRSIRQLAPGVIIEFVKPVEADLDLLVNNRQIGAGGCVKIGEHFGLRLTQVVSQTERIESLGSGE